MSQQHQVGDSEFRSFNHGSRLVEFRGLRAGELPVSIKWALRSDSLLVELAVVGPGFSPITGGRLAPFPRLKLGVFARRSWGGRAFLRAAGAAPGPSSARASIRGRFRKE